MKTDQLLRLEIGGYDRARELHMGGVRRSLVLVAALAACGRVGFEPRGTTDAQTWRLELTFDNSAGGEDLIDFPVLVVLDPSRIDYAMVQSAGADLAFVDADGAMLAHEVELWDPSGRSFVWGRVPRIAARSSTDHIFAILDAAATPDPATVWAEYRAVWHFAEAPGTAPAALDSSPNGNHGSFQPTMIASNLVTGVIGSAMAFDGVDDFIEVPDVASLDITTFTLEAWVLTTAATSGTILCKDGVGSDTAGAYCVYVLSGTNPVYETNNRSVGPFVGACCVQLGAWRHVAFTLDAGAMSRGYLDGAMKDEKVDIAPSDTPTSLLIGRRGLADRFATGAIDELRVSAVPRSAAWLSAQYAAMTDTFITYRAL